VCSYFNTSRQVQEYFEKFYNPADKLNVKLLGDHAGGAKELSAWKKKIGDDWSKVWVFDVKANNDEPMKAGSTLDVVANVSLGPISPDQVAVELYHGPLDANGQISNPSFTLMTKTATQEKKAPEFPIHSYSGKVVAQSCGQQGFAVRVLPKHPTVDLRMEPGLIRWS
jgi:starch phosphorylase